jgi:asparagine N-glycosylation enzyme membrane subunit Stt3
VISLRTQLVCGLAVQTFALLWLAAGSRGEGLIQIALPLVLMGVATALVVPALLNRFMDAAPVGRGALMGGINVSATQVGTLIGIALFGSILGAGLAPRFAGDLRAADSPVRATPARVARLASHGPDAAVANVVDPAIRARAVRAGKEAYVDATAHAINVAAAFSGASVLLLLILGGRLTPTAEGSRT